MPDERERYRRIAADNRQIREVSRFLCAVAQEQREFCDEQLAMSPRRRNEAIRDRRERLFTP